MCSIAKLKNVKIKINTACSFMNYQQYNFTKNRITLKCHYINHNTSRQQALESTSIQDRRFNKWMKQKQCHGGKSGTGKKPYKIFSHSEIAMIPLAVIVKTLFHHMVGRNNKKTQKTHIKKQTTKNPPTKTTEIECSFTKLVF